MKRELRLGKARQILLQDYITWIYAMLCKNFLPVWIMPMMILFMTETDSASCPENGVFYQNLQVCFWKLTNKRSAGNSNDMCKQDGGLLASIPDVNTLNFIIQNYGSILKQGIDVYYGVWIGVKDDTTEGQYMNYNGDIQVWTNWRTGDPNDDGTPIQDCVAMYPMDLGSPYSWQDRNCDENKIALCFKKIAEVDTTTLDIVTTSSEVKSTNSVRNDIGTFTTKGIMNNTESSTSTGYYTKSSTLTGNDTESSTSSQQNQDTINSFSTASDNENKNIYVNTSYSSVIEGDITPTSGLISTAEKTTKISLTGMTVLTETTTYTADVTSYCGCICGSKVTLDSNDFKRLLSELVIEKKNTSASRRKLISADDNRPSARNIGYLGASLLCVVLALIVLLDLTSICMPH